MSSNSSPPVTLENESNEIREQSSSFIRRQEQLTDRRLDSGNLLREYSRKGELEQQVEIQQRANQGRLVLPMLGCFNWRQIRASRSSFWWSKRVNERCILTWTRTTTGYLEWIISWCWWLSLQILERYFSGCIVGQWRRHLWNMANRIVSAQWWLLWASIEEEEGLDIELSVFLGDLLFQ